MKKIIEQLRDLLNRRKNMENDLTEFRKQLLDEEIVKLLLKHTDLILKRLENS